LKFIFRFLNIEKNITIIKTIHTANALHLKNNSIIFSFLKILYIIIVYKIKIIYTQSNIIRIENAKFKFIINIFEVRTYFLLLLKFHRVALLF